MLEQLRSEDSDLIREAAWRAGEEVCEDAVPVLAELLRSHNLGVQEAAEQALRKIGGAITVRNMVPLLHSDEAPVRNLAMDILREVGNQDFASMVDILHDEDPDIRIFSTDILGSTDNPLAVAPLCESLLKDPEVNVRYQAAVSLGNLAQLEATICLNKALDDEEWVQFAVIEALTKIRAESSVDALVRALDGASDLVASMIVEALGEMGNVKAATMLLKRLDDSPTALRNKIVQALIKILGGRSLTLLSDSDRDKLREYLLVALDDEEADIQDASVNGLGYVGGDEATDKLLELAAGLEVDTDHERLAMIVKSLSRIGLNPSLKRGLEQETSAQKAMVAVEAMGRIGGTDVSSILMEVFWYKDRDLQREIVKALVAVGEEEAAGFFLEVLDKHEDGTVLKAALKFLGGKLRLREAGETVFSLLEHPYNDVKEAALDAAIEMGGEEMAARFDGLFSSSDPLHRLMAVYALGRMREGSDPLDKLKHALEDEVPDIRKVAVESLAEKCGFDPECAPFITSRLVDENEDVRLAVVELLGKLDSRDVAPYLLQALADDNDWVRIRAMEALAALGFTDAVPHLVPLLESGNKLVVLKVIECLGLLGGQAAFRALLEMSGSEDQEFVDAAEDAVSRLQSREERD